MEQADHLQPNDSALLALLELAYSGELTDEAVATGIGRLLDKVVGVVSEWMVSEWWVCRVTNGWLNPDQSDIQPLRNPPWRRASACGARLNRALRFALICDQCV